MPPSKIIRNTFLTGLCVGLLSGCAWLEDWPPKGSEMATKTAPKPPESKIMQTSEGTWLDSEGQVPAPVSAAEPRGIAVDPASVDRITQLEQQIDGIRSDLSLMMPALTRLAEAQGDLQKVMNQVEPAAGQPAAYMAAQPLPLTQAPAATAAAGLPPGAAPGSVAWYEEQERMKRQQGAGVGAAVQQQAVTSASPAAAWQQQPQPAGYQQQPGGYGQQEYQPAAQAPATASVANLYQQAAYQPSPQPVPAPQGYAAGGASVTGLRFGEHSDKTRLVLDTSNKVAFSYNIDNNERLLVVTLPGTGWQAAREMAVGNSPLVTSYSVVPDNAGGSQLIMQLRQPVRVLWAQAMEPGGPQGHRVVFDLAAL